MAYTDAHKSIGFFKEVFQASIKEAVRCDV